MRAANRTPTKGAPYERRDRHLRGYRRVAHSHHEQRHPHHRRRACPAVGGRRPGRGQRHSPARPGPGGWASGGRPGTLPGILRRHPGRMRGGGVHHHRRGHRPDHRGKVAGHQSPATGVGHLQPGHDELRLVPNDPPLRGTMEIRLGGAFPGKHQMGAVRQHFRRHRIYARRVGRRNRMPVRV